MIGEADFRGWRHPQGLMHPTPIVERDMQGDSRTVGADFLTVGTRPSRTPTQVHSHGQVGPLDMVGGTAQPNLTL